MPKLINNATLKGKLDTLDVNTTSKAIVELTSIWFDKKADKPIWTDGLLSYTIVMKNNGDPDATPPDAPLTLGEFTDLIDPEIAKVIVDSIKVVPASAGKVPDYNPTSGILTIPLNDIDVGEVVTITFQVERVV